MRVEADGLAGIKRRRPGFQHAGITNRKTFIIFIKRMECKEIYRSFFSVNDSAAWDGKIIQSMVTKNIEKSFKFPIELADNIIIRKYTIVSRLLVVLLCVYFAAVPISF